MTFANLAEIDPFLELSNTIESVSSRESGFRRWADMQIIASLAGLAASSETRGAAAELARDCGTLVDDLSRAGATPTGAWEQVIHDDRARAIVSLRRFASLWSGCEPRDPKTGAHRLRPGSVPMQRKTWRKAG